MPAYILEHVKQRKNYYRDNFRRLLRFLIISFVIIIFLLIANLYILFNLPAPTYYASSSSGQMMELFNVPRGTGIETIDKEDNSKYLAK